MFSMGSYTYLFKKALANQRKAGGLPKRIATGCPGN